jgi:hypothetical protein
MSTEAPLDRDAHRPGREVIQLQGQHIIARKVMDIHLLDMSLKELTPFELGALLCRQEVEVNPRRIPASGNRWAIADHQRTVADVIPLLDPMGRLIISVVLPLLSSRLTRGGLANEGGS